LRAVIARELSDSKEESAAQDEIARSIRGELAKSAQSGNGLVSSKTATSKSGDGIQRGLELLKSKQYEEGSDMLLPLSRRPTASPQLQLEVAKALHALEKYEAAAELLEQAAARRRSDPEPIYWLALAY